MKDFNITVQFCIAHLIRDIKFLTGLKDAETRAYGTRSIKGRETCERLWTVVGTCAMQGRSAFEFILAAVRAHFRGEPAPSLLPALG